MEIAEVVRDAGDLCLLIEACGTNDVPPIANDCGPYLIRHAEAGDNPPMTAIAYLARPRQFRPAHDEWSRNPVTATRCCSSRDAAEARIVSFWRRQFATEDARSSLPA